MMLCVYVLIETADAEITRASRASVCVCVCVCVCVRVCVLKENARLCHSFIKRYDRVI